LAGIERTYDDLLNGTPKSSTQDIHSKRGLGPNKEYQQGSTLVLTIDTVLQYRTEQALSSAIEQSQARSGVAIALDPHSGEIVTLPNLGPVISRDFRVLG
jgi:cell division protein FtsI (penicillin-binding protein 3)